MPSDVVQSAQSALALLDLSVRKLRDAGLDDIADQLERVVEDATADYSAWAAKAANDAPRRRDAVIDARV